MRCTAFVAALLSSIIGSCSCFQRSSMQWRKYRSSSSVVVRRQSAADVSSRADQSAPCDLFLISWDGCLADCVPWRTRIGIKAAMDVWPEVLLSERYEKEDLSWLKNKLSSVAHCFAATASDEHSTTCEYALATRLLLEEQELDQGASVGSSGKYANQYHPRRQSTESVDSFPKQRMKTSSRPLTVGEISVNWSEGGMIRDTIQTRYHCNYQDPIPILQQAIESIVTTDTSFNDIPIIDAAVRNALLECCDEQTGDIRRRHVFVTVSHACEVPVAVASLEKAGISYTLASSVGHGLQSAALTVNQHVTLLVSSTCTSREMLQELPHGSTLYIIDSSWSRLQMDIVLFSDNMPRLSRGMIARSGIEPTKQLCLCLTGTGATIDPTQQAAATMSPWTRFLTAADFVELLATCFV